MYINFFSYYFARPHRLQSFNFNRAEIKAVCLSVCLSVFLDYYQAEVQSAYSDGSLSLHTRSLKYGKVGLHDMTFLLFSQL